jgi:hypothetical protein
MHEIDVQSPGAQAALRIQPGMLVYPHVEGGRVVYVSARSIEGKTHYNPPSELIGERRVYVNWEFSPRSDELVVVEGQADAVTCGQWGIPALALAGCSANEELLVRLARHQRVYLALDQDEGGVRAAREIAEALGPLTRMLVWPAKDANEWLQEGATREDAQARLKAAATWAEVAALEAGRAENGQRLEAMRRVFKLLLRLDNFGLATLRERLAKLMSLGLREFNSMLQAVRDEVSSDVDDAPSTIVECPGGWVGGQLFELIYQPPADAGIGTGDPAGGGKTLFAVRRADGTIETAPHLDWDGIRYAPIPPCSRILSQNVVLFPSSLGEELPLSNLIGRIQAMIHKYVDLDASYELISSFYVLLSWLFDCFNTVPYLRALGDAGTGKSRLIQVVGAMCYRPTFVSGAATTSPIFRILNRYHGTLILDEGDFGRSDEAADIVKILNTGYQRVQGTVLRSGDRDTGFEPEVFCVYGPKVIATRKRFDDVALETRCLTKEMGAPTRRLDIPRDLALRFWTEEAPAIRADLLMYRLRFWRREIELTGVDFDVSVEPRLAQVIGGLLTVAAGDENVCADIRGFVTAYNRQLIDERGLGLAARVLEAIVIQYGLESSKPPEQQDLALSSVTRWVNFLIDFENEAATDGSQHDQVQSRSVGAIVRRDLQLQTERRRHGRRHHIIYESDRVQALCARYGITDDIKVDLLASAYEALAQENTAGGAEQTPLNLV